MRFRRSLTAAVVAAIAAASLSACSNDPAQPSTVAASADASATFEYTIPVGAGEALDAGTPLEILPAELDARVGDTIRLVNDDVRGHTVGPFFVGAQETLSQRFSSAGEFVGVCTVHPSGEIVLVVSS